MTNIALALRMKPEIETKIKRIVFMGGNYKVPGNTTPIGRIQLLVRPRGRAHRAALAHSE